MSALEAPATVFLKDYRPPHYRARKVRLTVDLDPEATLITSLVSYKHEAGSPQTLRLHGKDLELLRIRINGQEQALANLRFSPEFLELENLPPSFDLELLTRTYPRRNAALEGLYLSHEQFYTQCEPEGFRRLTYYLDRPDVMAEFETTILAPKGRFPVLLSNGNLISKGERPDGKHFAVWHDPFPKPSYLFALVAGDLSCVADHYVTLGGKKIAIHIYVERENIDKCAFAMEAIKRAMRWDEEVYKLAYDLDLFMVVAVSDFNMGAMENKGLNIFNAKYVLASPETATDTDFENILGVVGHEYFHNWSGNRVTLRDWFQLSLKEGLTVFRDQQFSADQGSAAVKRIMDVRALREQQFPEDSGPMAHPVRPDSYIEINNFYTPTIYNKGAELIRMLHSIIGPETFIAAMQEYFRAFDGQAATIEDFLSVVDSAWKGDLGAFKLWYHQAGTPLVSVASRYEAATKRLHLTLRQTSGLKEAASNGSYQPMLIPVRTALISRQGTALISRHSDQRAHEHLLLFQKLEETFVFEEVAGEAIASVLRNFSAPVRIERQISQEDLYVLLAHETDAFNKYEVTQTLAQQMLNRDPKDGLPEAYSTALGTLLSDESVDQRVRALAMQVPSLDYLIQQQPLTDLDLLFKKRLSLQAELARRLRPQLYDVYERCHDVGGQGMDREAIGRRELKNACLQVLAQNPDQELIDLAMRQYQSSRTMTDSVAALTALASLRTPAREECLEHFYQRWKKDPLVVDKWFSIQASSFHPEVLMHVKQLLRHPDFDILNPNRVYSIFRQFSRANPFGFHHPTGEGYAVVASYVLQIDRKNPQVAAMLASFLSRYQKFDSKRQPLMRRQLEEMMNQKPLSRDVFEVVSKSLKA